MPHFNVRIREEELDGRVEPALIRALTDAVVAVYGERARELVVVGISGVPGARWGSGGVVATDNAPIVSLTMRERALHLPEIDDPPARLIASITEAVVAVFGEAIRPKVTVLIDGIPAGRSGVGGEPV